MPSWKANMLTWLHRALCVVFCWFATGAFAEERRLGGKVLWMYLSRHRPAEAVIADGFHGIGFNLAFVLIMGGGVIWLERRYAVLARRLSPAEARAWIRGPEWLETAHRAVERRFRR